LIKTCERWDKQHFSPGYLGMGSSSLSSAFCC